MLHDTNTKTSFMEESVEYSLMSESDSSQAVPIDEQYQYPDFYSNQNVDFNKITNNYYGETVNENRNSTVETIDSDMDYETLIRSRHLYYDPEPKLVRETLKQDQVVYKQNVTVRYLQPPPIPQETLIIREVRPPQPPPPPPLVIRQRTRDAPTPPPLILREKPPPKPSIMTAKYVTRILSPAPVPPRSVIVEKLPQLPPKPRDIIIERWLPYESTKKRRIIVQRAEKPKQYPTPRNLIINYEPVQAKIVRHIERLPVTREDPINYSTVHRNALLNTEQLLKQIQLLGINEDLLPSNSFDQNQQISSNTINFKNSFPLSSNSYIPNYQSELNDIYANNINGGFTTEIGY